MSDLVKDIAVRSVYTHQSDFLMKTVISGINESNKWFCRKFNKLPKFFGIGSKVFYIEKGKVIGYGVVDRIVKNPKQKIGSMSFAGGFSVYMLTEGWKWIEPQDSQMIKPSGWQYFDSTNTKVVGNWSENENNIPQPIRSKEVMEVIEIGRKNGFFQ